MHDSTKDNPPNPPKKERLLRLGLGSIACDDVRCLVVGLIRFGELESLYLELVEVDREIYIGQNGWRFQCCQLQLLRASAPMLAIPGSSNGQ
jgi:hypothetical protein